MQKTVTQMREFLKTIEERQKSLDTRSQFRRDVDKISLPESDKLTRKDINAISYEEISDKDYPLVEEIKQMPLKSKLELMTDKQFNALVERIVSDLEKDEFEALKARGDYDSEPKLKAALIKGFDEKEKLGQKTTPRKGSTVRRSMR